MEMRMNWLLVALLLASVPAAAGTAPAQGQSSIREIPDAELGDMRGRFTVAGYGVAWFGVSMVSTWVTPSGQLLQGTLGIGMDFDGGGAPRLVIVPSVTLEMNAQDATAATVGMRSVNAEGLQNVSGLTQSVQVAGDGNAAFNGLRFEVRDGDIPGASGNGASQNSLMAQSGDASVMAGIQGNAARLQLRIEGQGMVEQWLRSGSVGQGIQIAADGQRARNGMKIELVRQPLSSSPMLTQNVAQAITLARGVGR